MFPVFIGAGFTKFAVLPAPRLVFSNPAAGLRSDNKTSLYT
jgi:hypothetical protein